MRLARTRTAEGMGPQWHLKAHAWVALLLVSRLGMAASPPSSAGSGFAADPVLQQLVAEAQASRPELALAQATVAALRHRSNWAGALPDPELSLGMQNDGFGSLQIGKMEGSYVSIMAAQRLPWFGKRDLETEIAAGDARQAETDLERTLLRLRGDVERAYLEVLVVRAAQQQLADLTGLWAQAATLSRNRYEAQNGSQAELLRAQLEQSRLTQRARLLAAAAQQRLFELNRLCGRPASAPLVTSRSLVDLPDPELPGFDAALAAAEAQSPELKQATLGIAQVEQRQALAQKGYYPDLTLRAGVMPRGGDFPTMWQLGVGFSLPVWSGTRQGPAVAEQDQRALAKRASVAAVRDLLQQRVRERQLLLATLIESNRFYRTTLLPQSQAWVTSALSQYQVGSAGFAAVLESLSGYVNDQRAYQASVAATARLEIAAREVSLDQSGLTDSEGMASPTMGDSSEAATSSGAANGSQQPGADAPNPSSMSGM